MIPSIRNSWISPVRQLIMAAKVTSPTVFVAKRTFSNMQPTDTVKINPLFLKQKIQNLLEPTMESYGQLSSECYGLWFPDDQEYEDAALYRKYIQNSGQPALEIGCGDGRLMVPYVCEGLDVEGVDLSPFMIENCQKKAEKKGVSVNLYEQAMQNLDIPKKFGTIYIPYGSFMLVSDLKESTQAIKRFYDHLLPGGHLMISLFIPTDHDIHVDAPKGDEWRLRREGNLPNGNQVRVWEKPVFDTKEQIEDAEYRYEILSNGTIVSTEMEHLKLRWYTQAQFTNLLKNTGFDSIQCLKGHSEIPASAEDCEFTFVAKKN